VYLYLDRAHYWYMSRKEARRARKADKAGIATDVGASSVTDSK
jgi:HAE1 family hydrophobic/amphiphilic exporter-1